MEFALETANRIYYRSEQLEISSAVTRTEHYPAHTTAFQLMPLKRRLKAALRCRYRRDDRLQ
jgi:hypothetical protein